MTFWGSCYKIYLKIYQKRRFIMKMFKNPILLNHADPDILFHNGIYYLYSTSMTIDHAYEVYTSTDLVNWENRGICLENALGLTRWYWAPDVKEKDGVFYMLFTADEHMGLAVADSPLGPFVPTGFVLDRSIDGHIYFEGDDMYIYYVSWREGHEYALWGCKVNSDYKTPDLSTEKIIFKATEPYECNMNGVVEAPYMLKKNGKYYLTYSASHYESPFYCVAYAVADSPLGEFVKYKNNPILVGDNKTVNGIGHHCITYSPDKSQMFIVYHTHDEVGKIHPRKLSISTIEFAEENGETILRCKPHTFEEQPYPIGE